ncbi:hypothetical protein BDW71DRAFT_191012 [Aspergillus fruticulosus]
MRRCFGDRRFALVVYFMCLFMLSCCLDPSMQLPKKSNTKDPHRQVSVERHSHLVPTFSSHRN